jgi:hypothetical protein
MEQKISCGRNCGSGDTVDLKRKHITASLGGGVGGFVWRKFVFMWGLLMDSLLCRGISKSARFSVFLLELIHFWRKVEGSNPSCIGTYARDTKRQAAGELMGIATHILLTSPPTSQQYVQSPSDKKISRIVQA